jgi:glycosyltransferase involved in cell wall biosynthesis
LNTNVLSDEADQRSMGIGLQQIVITPANPTTIFTEKELSRLSLSGVVYTTVFNPDDYRKNWEDIITAFCYAFYDNTDATLVLKITHHHLGSFLGKFHNMLVTLGDFSCKIILLHGYLEKPEFEKLIDATSYYVNASNSEGLCMPLMEFMAAGKPAVATNNTAMADYFDNQCGFVVESNEEPTSWPHDERRVKRAIKYRPNWESLVSGLLNSYALAKNDVNGYSRLAKNSTSAIQSFASTEVVIESFQHFFNEINIKGDK